jgi:hypothetical protein
VAIPSASFSRLPVRTLPEPIFLVPGLPAHRAHAAPHRDPGAFAFHHTVVSVRAPNQTDSKKVDFFQPLRMMEKGDGVRRITAVLFCRTDDDS